MCSFVDHITFVGAVDERKVLESNLMAFLCLRSFRDHQILIQENCASAPKAYNDAIERATPI